MADVRFSVLSGLVVLPLSAELPQLPLLVQVPAPPSTLSTPLTARKLPLPYHSPFRFKLSACLNSLPLLVQTSSVFVFVSDHKQTSGAGCRTGARGWHSENTIGAACDWRSTQLTIDHKLCDCSVAAPGMEGEEEKACLFVGAVPL